MPPPVQSLDYIKPSLLVGIPSARVSRLGELGETPSPVLPNAEWSGIEARFGNATNYGWDEIRLEE